MFRRAIAALMIAVAALGLSACPQTDNQDTGERPETTTSETADNGADSEDSPDADTGSDSADEDEDDGDSGGPSSMPGADTGGMGTSDADSGDTGSGDTMMGMEGSGDIVLGMEGDGDVILGMEGSGDIILSDEWSEQIMPDGLESDLAWELKVAALQAESYYYGEEEFTTDYSEIVDAGYAVINPGVPSLKLSSFGNTLNLSGNLRSIESGETRQYQLEVQPDTAMAASPSSISGDDWSFGRASTLESKFGISGQEEIRRAVKGFRLVHDLANLAFFYMLENGEVPETSDDLLNYGSSWIVGENLVNPYTGEDATFSDRGGSGADISFERTPHSYGHRQTGRLKLVLQNLPEELDNATAREELFTAELSPASGRVHTWR